MALSMNESRRDMLISRVVDGAADARDWDELFADAERDRSVWRQVVEAQRDQSELADVMGRAGEVAEGVDARTSVARAARTPVTSSGRAAAGRRIDPGLDWGRWVGWAVAAAVIFAWSAGLPGPVARPAQPGAPAAGAQLAGLGPVATARDAFQAYLDKGREEGTVLSTEPRRVLLETRPIPAGGGYELIYVQQVMERAVVPHLFRVGGQDERGRPALIRFEQPVAGEM